MPHIQQHFSIKDLESLSGVKAHTLRMWEKRYGVLQPERTHTNIRVYDIAALQKLLNIVFLNENGYKISQISQLKNLKLQKLVHTISTGSNYKNRAVKSFKLAMVNFDPVLFNKTFEELSRKKSFREIFHEVFIPLLSEMGMLWQTEIINPAHEHFISSQIKQKLYVQIEKLQPQPQPDKKMFVLFLPQGEIHELGLLYTQYELLLHRRQTIFLGNSIAVKDLRHLIPLYEDIVFVSYFTIRPTHMKEHLQNFAREICVSKWYEYWILGPKIREETDFTWPEYIKPFHSIMEMKETL